VWRITVGKRRDLRVIIRRNFLKLFGASGAAGLFAAGGAGAQAPPRQPARSAAGGPRRLDVSVGALDLNHVELVDTHVHPPHRMTLKQSYDMWNDSFVDAMVPDYDFPGKKDLRAKLTTEFVDQIWDLPRQTGYNNYMARTYGVPPTLEGFKGPTIAGIPLSYRRGPLAIAFGEPMRSSGDEEPEGFAARLQTESFRLTRLAEGALLEKA